MLGTGMSKLKVLNSLRLRVRRNNDVLTSEIMKKLTGKRIIFTTILTPGCNAH